ncbi:unnamed protein product [Parnassius apollo]|uniref:(apollo) hypothetical protein n=1 Tax=Parnassius apollo TaxID=110799 RepID=A0A8S3WN07_PARAO|nr:unnamed protein product [Parnassius apollo]
MSVVRTCVYFLVLSVSFHSAVGKPFFGTRFWCDLFCDDDDEDDVSTTSTSTEDYFDDLFVSCSDCPTRRPPRRRLPTDIPNPNMAPLSFMIPPMTGMGVTVSNRNGTWLMNLSPWNSPATTATSAAAATTTAATTAGTGGTTVAPTTVKK